MLPEKLNCWEAEECGREPGGANADALGVCPATTAQFFDGTNCGKNGGRFCWAVAGTLCDGVIQGTFAMKATSCMHCQFYLQVVQEERGTLVLSPEQLE
jgi:hypothetical protein